MSRERDQMMGHSADNDGIEEYDNPLPDWWIGMFIFTILFAIGYTLEYHFISGYTLRTSPRERSCTSRTVLPVTSPT